MASRVDSLQDIFGPSEPNSTEALEPAAPGAASSTANLNEFDDIFASSNDDAPPAGPAGDSVARALKSKDVSPVPGSNGSTEVSPSTHDFEDIFGNAPTAAEGGLLPSSSKEQTGGKSDQAGGTTSDVAGSGEASQAARSDTKDLEVGAAVPSHAPVTGGGAGGDDSEFLNFLYDDDKQGKAAATAAATTVTPQAEETADSAATTATSTTTAETAGETTSSNPGNTSSSPADNRSPLVQPPGVSGASSPSSDLDSVPLGSPLVEDTTTTTTAATTAAVAAAAARLEVAVKEGKLDAPPHPPSSEMCFVRKEKVEILLPLPENPASALRELASPETTAGAETGEGEVAPGTEGLTSREGGRAGPSRASDVGYVRRLCAASGGFLPPDLRSVVWGLLLGLGRKPEDAGFVKWREARRRDPSLVAGAATVAYMLDLRNDCLALARRLCDDGGGGDGEGGGGAGVKGGDPEALAVDIEEVRGGGGGGGGSRPWWCIGNGWMHVVAVVVVMILKVWSSLVPLGTWWCC